MSDQPRDNTQDQQNNGQPRRVDNVIKPPLPNYTLSTVCPACATPTYRHACKVRCPKCGFMWDCSEL